MKTLRRWALPLLILGGAVLVFIWLKATKPASTPVSVQEKAWPVAVQTVHKHNAAPTLELYGRIDSLWSTTLVSAVNADVAEIPVIEGSELTAGVLLMRLDDRDARLELAQQLANRAEAQARIQTQETRHQANLESLPREKRLLELAQNEVHRLAGLVKSKATSESSLDTARQAVERQAVNINNLELSIQEHPSRMAELQAQLQRAQALLDTAELNLSRTEIKAPYRAAVAKLLVAPGQRVRPGDKLAEVFDLDAMIFRALVPEHYVANLSSALGSGQSLAVSAELDGQPISASLLSLGSQVTTGSGGVEGIFRMDSGTMRLQKGRLTKIELTLPELPNLLSVPHEALYGPTQIYRVDAEQRLRLVQVERMGESVDAQGNSRVLLRSQDLQEGDQVLSTQLASAIDGLLVKVVQAND